MSAKRQTTRAGSFILAEEPGSISRDAAFLAEGENLQAGTLLKEADGGDLVAWTTDADCAGILFAGTDARVSRQSVAIVSRLAVVNLELLTFPDGGEVAARDALEAVRIEVRADHVIADTGGGGGGAYVAKAVHFGGSHNGDGDFLIGGHSTGTTQVASFSFWVNVADLTNYAFFMHQAEANAIDLSTGFNFATYDLVIDAMGGNINQGTPDNTVPLNQWLHMCGNMDLNHPQGSRVMNVLLNGVSVLDHSLDADSTSGTAVIDKTLDFVIPGYTAVAASNIPLISAGEGVAFDTADYMVWLGTFIDWSDPANLAKVISAGKPVDPAGAVSAFGLPQVYLTGDATTFATNQGTGGPFTLVGSITNATTSPSD